MSASILKQKLGYRLAAERFHFTGQSSLKTIKFPITSRNKALDRKLIDSLRHDYTVVYGALNYPEYCKYAGQQSTKPYSVFDFWIDSLRAGVLWSSSFSKAENLLLSLTNSQSFYDSLAERLAKQLSIRVGISLNYINKEKICERLQGDPRGLSTLPLVIKEFKKYFSTSSEKSEQQDQRINQYINEYIRAIPKNTKQFYTLFFSFFALEDAQKQFEVYKGNPYSLTFIFNPNWDLKLHTSDSPQDLVITLHQLFGENALAYMGLKDNFNGFQNYFGDVIHVLMSGNSQKLFDALLGAYPEYQKQDIETRLRWLADRARQLGADNSSKLGKSLADLRMGFGGALASWVANFTRSSANSIFDLTEKHIELSTFGQDIKNTIYSTITFKNEVEKKRMEQTKYELEVLIEELLAISENYCLTSEKNQLREDKKSYTSVKISDLEKKKSVIEKLAPLQRKIVPEEIEQYGQILAEFRLKANQFYQQYMWRADSTVLPQKHTSKKNNKKKILSAGESFKVSYSAIITELPTLPAFIGVVKQKKFAKYNMGVKDLEQGLLTVGKYIAQLSQFPTDSALSTTKSLQALLGSLARKLSSQSYQGEFAKKARIILKKYLTDDILQDICKGNVHKYRFVESVYDRNTSPLICYKWMCEDEQAHREIYTIHQQLISLCSAQLSDYYLATEKRLDSDALRGSIETWKSAVAFFCKTAVKTEIAINKSDFVFSESALLQFNRLTSQKEIHITPQRFNFFFQIGVFTELKGLLSLLSQQETVSRYVVQTVNGNQQELQYIPSEQGKTKVLASPAPKDLQAVIAEYQTNPAGYLDFVETETSGNEANRHLFFYPHEYALSIKNHSLKGADRTVQLQKKSERQLQFKGKLDKTTLFYLHSSLYQTQFLEWFLCTPKTKKVELDIAGGSLICEVKIHHNIVLDKNGKLQTEFREDVENARLYTSIPFEMNVHQVIKNQSVYIFKNDRRLKTSGITVQYALPQRFIGIDLGEFGLAYSVLEIPTESYLAINKHPFSISQGANNYCESNIPMIHVLESGFILEPGLETIRKGVSDLKRKQVLGTFASTETYLARLRESVSNTLRNKVHSIALKYGAKIVYEGSVTGFETGGKKILKLYKTIKTPDVMGESRNEADKAAMKNVWGNESLKIALEISAVDTSQLSLEHRKSYKDVIREDSNYTFSILHETVNRKNPEEKIYEICVKAEGDTGLYFPVSATQLEAIKKAGYITGKNLFNLCKKALRPSRNEVTSNEEKILKEKYADLWHQAKRGNSYIYRDLFEQDRFEDADIQAATNIALRGIVKECLETNTDVRKDNFDLFNKIQKEENKNFYKNVKLITI